MDYQDFFFISKRNLNSSRCSDNILWMVDSEGKKLNALLESAIVKRKRKTLSINCRRRERIIISKTDSTIYRKDLSK